MTKKPKKPVIGITIGDPNGIGPEIIIKALSEPGCRELADYRIIGNQELFNDKSVPGLDSYDIDQFDFVSLDVDTNGHELIPGKVSKAAGLISGKAIESAVYLAQNNEIDAIVTAPISKEALNIAGYSYPGHTEFLARLCDVEDVVMVMVSKDFRVALMTTHCAVADVSKLLSVQKIVEKVRILYSDFVTRFGIKQPKFAVAGLNPHAGEAGLFGREEIEIINPALKQLKSERINVQGPFPADTMFASIESKPFDVYLTMYHDQGLIPIKMKAFGKIVNYTAGLPVIRTSPDHGTAFDIAGKGVASSSSLQEAIALAHELASKNKNS